MTPACPLARPRAEFKIIIFQYLYHPLFSSALCASEYQKYNFVQYIIPYQNNTSDAPTHLVHMTTHVNLMKCCITPASDNLEPCNSYIFANEFGSEGHQRWHTSLLFWVMPERGSVQTVEPFLILSCPLIISASGRPRVPAGFLLAPLQRKRPRTEADGSPVYAPASATLEHSSRDGRTVLACLARIAHLSTQSRLMCWGLLLLCRCSGVDPGW